MNVTSSVYGRPSAFRVPLGKDLVQIAVKQLLCVRHATHLFGPDRGAPEVNRPPGERWSPDSGDVSTFAPAAAPFLVAPVGLPGRAGIGQGVSLVRRVGGPREVDS